MDFKYPYTDAHELNLDWFLSQFKTLTENWVQVQSDWTDLHDYVQDYFENLDVQDEINNKIQSMIDDNSFATILTPLVAAALPTIVDGKLPNVVAAQIGAVVAAQIGDVVAGQLPAVAATAAAQEVSDWLAAHVDPDTGYVIDDTLTISLAAADAKATGDRISDFIANFFNSFDNNILFGKTLHRGYRYSQGSKLSDANYAYTDLIPVLPDTSYKLFDAGTPFIDFYASDETYISETAASNNFNTPATAAFIRVSIYYTRWNTAKIVPALDDEYINLYDQCGGFPLGVEKNQLFNTFLDINDMNDAIENRIYILQLTSSSTLTNLPDNFDKNGLAFLYTYKGKFTNYSYQIFQYLEKTTTGQRWIRSYRSDTSTWTAWTERFYKTDSLEIHIGAGQQYTTMKAGMTAAYAMNNAKVTVHPGTYDLITEFNADISATMNKTGLPLGNGMHVYFMEGAKVTANFDNSGGTYDAATWSRIYEYFNPFYANVGDYVLENADIEAANTRYCVHDELGGVSTYRHIYKNCKMKYVNNHSDVKYVQCIGGGLGEHGYIEIDGGIYECETDYGITSVGGDPADSQQVISYHNGWNVNAKSSIFVKDVYIKNRGYMRFSSYGPSTSTTEVNISSCGSGLPVLIKPETGYTTINVAVNDFCNEKRNPYHWVVSGTTATLTSDT